MSNVSISAEGASEKKPARIVAKVVDRKVLYKGQIVEIQIPKKAKEGSCDVDGVILYFLQFALFLKGAVVNCFVHTTDTTLRGQTITAEVVVMWKKMEDGRQFLHIDFIPTPGKVANKRFGVVSGWSRIGDRTWEIFSTPHPLKAMIVVTPIETTQLVNGKIFPNNYVPPATQKKG